MIRVFDTCIVQEDRESVEKVLRSRMVGPGKVVERFQRELEIATGKKHAVCCNSGSSALLLSLMALGHDPGTPVAVPAYGMPAGAEAARMRGLMTLPYDLGDLPSPDSKVVISINHNGLPCPVAVPAGAFSINDSAQSLGIPGAFSFGNVCILSFSPQKLITCGQGGVVLTDSSNIADRVAELADHGGGWREDRKYLRLGGNYRMSDVNAALGISQLRRLDKLLFAREYIHDRYREMLPDRKISYGWAVVMESPRPAGLVAFLRERGIEALQLYRPINHHTPFKDGRNYPKAEYEYNHSVFLPSHLMLSARDVETVCRAIKDYSYE